MDEISLFEAIHTARAQRRFRPDPVPEALITRIFNITPAPTSNRGDGIASN